MREGYSINGILNRSQPQTVYFYTSSHLNTLTQCNYSLFCLFSNQKYSLFSACITKRLQCFSTKTITIDWSQKCWCFVAFFFLPRACVLVHLSILFRLLHPEGGTSSQFLANACFRNVWLHCFSIFLTGSRDSVFNKALLKQEGTVYFGETFLDMNLLHK